MEFKWKVERGKKLNFEDRVHNLACFEIVINILRMKTKSGNDNVKEEMQALCGFALDCMFKDRVLDDELFDDIIKLKDKKVHHFRADMLNKMGVPKEMVDANKIGEA